jgi:chromosome segregation ATPase
MKLFRPFQVALAGAALAATALAQTETDIRSLRTKAQRGNAVAQYNLGLAYLEGRGIGADPVEAYVWLSLARENGARGRALDNLIATLDNPTLEAARQQLTERRTTLGLRAPASGTVPNATPSAESGPAGVSNTLPGAPNAPLVATAPTQTSADASAALQHQLNEATADKRALSGEVASAWKEVDDLKARLAALIAEVDHAKQAATAAEADKKQLSAEVASAWKEADALKARLAAAENVKPTVDTTALEQKARELQATSSELDSARRATAQLTADLAAANEARAGLERQLNSAQSAAVDAGRRQDELQVRLADATADADQAKQEAEAARQALAAKPAAPGYPDLSGRVAVLEAALAAAQQSLAAKPVAPAYPDLRQRVGELESQLAEARRPQTPAYPDLRERVTSLESQLVEARKPQAPAYPDLSGRVSELTAQLTERDAQVQAGQAAGRQLKDALTELRQARESFGVLQAENAKLQALAEKPAAPAYPDLRERVASLEGQLTAALAKPTAPAYPDLSGRVEELETSTAKLAAQVQAAEKARAQAQAEFDKHSDSFHAAEREHTTLLAQNKMLESEKASLRRQIDSSAADATQLRSQIAALKHQLAEKPTAPVYPDLRGKVAGLEDELATARQALAAKPAAPAYPDLSSQVAELETQLADTRQALAEKPAAPAYPDLSGRVRELEGSHEVAAARIAELNALADQHTKLVTDLREALRKAHEKLPAAPTYPDLRVRVGELETQLAEATASAEQAKQEAEAAQQALSAKPAAPAYPDLRRHVGELEAQLAEARRPQTPAYPDLRERVATLESQLVEAQKPQAPTYPDLSGRVSELTAQLTERDAQVEAGLAVGRQLKDALTELRQAHESFTALQAENARLKTLAEKPAAPTYPDLSGRVRELETQLNDLAGRAGNLETKLVALTTAKSGVDTELQATRQQLNRAQQESADAAATTDQLRADNQALQAKLDRAAQPTAPAYPDLRERVGELEAQVAALRDAPPAFPDLRRRVSELEQQLAAQTKPAAPAYPDLSGRVQELEGSLASATGKIAAAEQARHVIAKQFDDYRTSTLAAQREHASLQSQVQMLESEKAALRRQADTTEAEATLLRAQVAKLKELSANAPAAPAYPDLRERVGELEAQVAALRDAPPAFPDLRRRVSELEQQLAAAQSAAQAKPTTPDYPDLRAKVAELEQQLAVKPAPSPVLAYPDLRDRVSELERQLAAGPPAAAKVEDPGASDLAQRLAAVEDRLATSLRGYALLEKERDELAARAEKAQTDLTADRNSLAARLVDTEAKATAAETEVARLAEQVGALQRASGPVERELAAARALLDRLRGANTVLAQENYQLKSQLAGAPAAASALPAIRTHSVAAGDSLSKISQRYYGTASRWPDIYNANRDVISPEGVLRVGSILRIP